MYLKKKLNLEVGNEDLKTRFQNFIDMTIGDKNYSKIAHRYAKLIKIDDDTFKDIKVNLIRKDKMIELNKAYVDIINAAISVINEYRQYHYDDIITSRSVALDKQFQKEFVRRIEYILEDFTSKMSNKQDYLPKLDTLGNLGYESINDLISVLDISVSNELNKIKSNTTYFRFIKGFFVALISAILITPVFHSTVLPKLIGIFVAANSKTSASEIFTNAVFNCENNLKSIINTLENIYNNYK